MKYNRLGKAGIKVSELSFGSWVTFGGSLDVSGARSCMKAAFDSGVNFFDNAEVYAGGESETIMGKILKDYRREDLVVSTKIFWGGRGPNDLGLSWKHLMEGTKNSLKRLQLSYVDLLFCHRPDPNTPIEETVRAMDAIIRAGHAFYWGTSEWPAAAIADAFELAEKYHCIPPTMEQPQYNMFSRERVELEYKPLFEKYQLGTTIWSPLASGALSGKYLDGRTKPSAERAQFVGRYLTGDNVEKLKQLKQMSQDLDCTLAQLAIAWCLKNKNVSTVITGATSVEQVRDNMKASSVVERITPDLWQKIETTLNNRPT